MRTCFATLAFGAQYRFHAQRLCQDLAEFAPDTSVLVLADRPSEFSSRENLIVEPYRPQGILRRYHDKRFLIERAFDRHDACIVIDANSRICEPLPSDFDLPEGISGFLVMPLEQHLCEEADDPAKKPSGMGSPEHARRQVERAAAELDVKLDDVSFIQESIYAVRGEPSRIRAFVECWGKLGAYFDYHGMAWSEGYGIGLAAAKCGLPVQQHPFLPLESFYKHRIHGALIERGQMTHEPVLRAQEEVRQVQATRFSMLPGSMAKRIEKGKMGCRWLLARAQGEPSLAFEANPVHLNGPTESSE